MSRFPAPGDAVPAPAPAPIRRDFESETLPPEFQWLRTPHPERIFSLTEQPGRLTLLARESIGSWFEQALVARPPGAFRLSRRDHASIFRPTRTSRRRGLVHYYNRHKFHFLAVTYDAQLGRVLTVMSCPGDWPDGRLTFPPVATDPPAAGPDRSALPWRSTGRAWCPGYRLGTEWHELDIELDASLNFRRGGTRRNTAPSPALLSAWRRSTPVAGPPGPAFTNFTYAPDGD